MLLVLGGLTLVYALGWRRLRARGGAALATWARLASYLGGIALLALALLSPIDALGDWLFSAHMVQHLLLMMAAPVLLWLALPMPIGIWGLPERVRHGLGRQLRHDGLLRRALDRITPWRAWFAFVLVLWAWHAPPLYTAAIGDGPVHDLEHLCFFGAAMLFWWRVLDAAPRARRPMHPALPIALMLAAFVQNEILGVSFALASEPIYGYYATHAFRPLGLSALADQQIGGAIMWIPGGMMLGLAAILLIARYADREQRRQQRGEQWRRRQRDARRRAEEPATEPATEPARA